MTRDDETMSADKRLIEDYLPIVAISAEASREKSVRKGHISTLHLWWARRPLVACRAAVYGALVPASRFVPNGGSDEQKKSLGRANAAKFVKALCMYPGEPRTIQEAQRHILIAHADRLTQELAEWKAGNMPKPGWVDESKFSGAKVAMDDIAAGRAPRPRVLDMFAGGGAIPLEALRLGCEAYALDLNPVAHIIQLGTLVYPQKYGNPDPTARGMTGPQNSKGEMTWGGLADEVSHWGSWVLKKATADIGDLYPPIPDPHYKGKKVALQAEWFREHDIDQVPPGYLVPVAYLWTRTVKCKNPGCAATVPLARQTWLCKKTGAFVALKMIARHGEKRVSFEVVESRTARGLGFDPAEFSKSGNAACPFCGTVADIDYIKERGWNGNIGCQLLTVACVDPKNPRYKVYVAGDEVEKRIPSEESLKTRIKRICNEADLSVPDEQIAGLRPDDNSNTLGIRVRPYGMRTFGDLFLQRQQASLLGFAAAIRSATAAAAEYDEQHKEAILAMLGCFHDRLVGFSSTGCVWNCLEGERTAHTFGRQTLSMTWDFSEVDPFNPANAGWPVAIDRIIPTIESIDFRNAAIVERGSATALSNPNESIDAIITDPPYYDNVPYADISDFFYVWLKRTVGSVFRAHLASPLTPKRTRQ